MHSFGTTVTKKLKFQLYFLKPETDFFFRIKKFFFFFEIKNFFSVFSFFSNFQHKINYINIEYKWFSVGRIRRKSSTRRVDDRPDKRITGHAEKTPPIRQKPSWCLSDLHSEVCGIRAELSGWSGLDSGLKPRTMQTFHTRV